MKRNKLVLSVHILLSVCAVFGWWGLLYPELTMTPSTYRIVYEDATVQEQDNMVEWDFDDTIYWDVLKADRNQIRFRSRLVSNVSALQEQGRGIHESGE